MFRKTVFVLFALGAALFVVATWPGQAAPAPAAGNTPLREVLALQYFHAYLSGGEEVPAVDTPAWGQAVMVLDTDTNTLYWRVEVQEIAGISGAHIHLGASGVNGGVEFPLFTGTGAFDPANPISGTLTLTGAQVGDLTAGNYYVNVHTGENPNGEIRGQLQTLTADTFNAILYGQNEIPVVKTDASGWAVLTLTGSNLNYEIHVTDTMTITAAHLHRGEPDDIASPEVTLYPPGGSPPPFGPGDPLIGTAALDPEQILALLSGSFYLNVHTSTNPAGEIRGQVTSGYPVFKALMSGENEVPPVDTPASGKALLVLDDDLHTAYIRVWVSDITGITLAHIHTGFPGASGPPLIPLFTGTGTFGPGDPISATVTLSDEQVTELVSGYYYVNVHTSSSPGGEIRGQLEPSLPTKNFFAELTGAQETPPVETGATGEAEFHLLPDFDALAYKLQVSGTVTITAAHLHPGWPDENNPPEVTLFAPGDTREFDQTHPLSGIAALGAGDLLDLISERFYINVHTDDYPAGEIRGQVLEQPTMYLPVIRSGGQPPE